MKLLALTAILLVTFYSANAQQLPATKGKELNYKIIPSENCTWGYDIYANGKLFIHQVSIPALPGNAGFSTKASAEKVATKVIEKIKNGENPPSITVEEMKQMGVIEQH